jgi:hypothetical protein
MKAFFWYCHSFFLLEGCLVDTEETIGRKGVELQFDKGSICPLSENAWTYPEASF